MRRNFSIFFLNFILAFITKWWQLGWFDIFNQSECSKTFITRWLWSRFTQSWNCKNTNWPDIFNWTDDVIIQFTSKNFSPWWHHRWLIPVIRLPNTFMFREIILNAYWSTKKSRTTIGQFIIGPKQTYLFSHLLPIYVFFIIVSTDDVIMNHKLWLIDVIFIQNSILFISKGKHSTKQSSRA